MTKRPRAAERDDVSYTPKVGWLLAHNHVRPAVDARGGVNGFRRFWVQPDPKWKLCECGWRPDLGPHYSGRAEKGDQ
jgi:hypothetical protein